MKNSAGWGDWKVRFSVSDTDSVCFVNKLGKRQFANSTLGGMFFSFSLCFAALQVRLDVHRFCKRFNRS
ncbi:hypothetical protein, partial [Deinococcus saxicola]|uniref:hypothetical protein n=1 Tax=Deinococcus saxicola TaxID=249406 RepID=UPI003D123430